MSPYTLKSCTPMCSPDLLELRTFYLLNSIPYGIPEFSYLGSIISTALSSR